MSPVACALLVMAKAPVSGQAKTRLAPAFTPDGAAELAAASLLDTLDAVRSSDVAARIVALSGDLSSARHGDEIARALLDFTVIPQRGTGFSGRLVRAHRDAARLAGIPVLQIGMDTPQVGADLLTSAASTLEGDGVDAVLGPATDGGWWALGVSLPTMASVLGAVPMSQVDTGVRTLSALQELGCVVSELPALSDVDTPHDARRVAADLGPSCRFRQTLERMDRASLGGP